MDAIERAAYREYKSGGQEAVYRFAERMGLVEKGEATKGYCKPCEHETVIYKGACLACGQLSLPVQS